MNRVSTKMKRVWIRSKPEETTHLREALQQAFSRQGFTFESQPGPETDVAVSIGGDGTFLATLRDLGEHRFRVPVLGVHGSSGRGFLLPVRPPREEGMLPAWAESVVQSLASRDFNLQERWGLVVRVVSARGEVLHDGLWALNDVVTTKSALSRMVWIKISVNGQALLQRFRGDGLIVASASGSTAYSLSAGGPILDPSLKNLIVTPVCPQTLAHRSVVLGEDARVEVEVLENTTSCHLTEDGQSGRDLAEGDRVEVTRAAQPVRFVVPKGLAALHEQYFLTLRSKLGYGGE